MVQIVKLVHEVDGEDVEFGVKLRPVSVQSRIRFLEVNQQHLSTGQAYDRVSTKIRDERDELLRGAQGGRELLRSLDPIADKELFESTKQIVAEAENRADELNFQINTRVVNALNITARFNVLYLKCSLDTRGLTAEQKELIATEPESEFWTSQSDEEIAAAVKRFRG